MRTMSLSLALGSILFAACGGQPDRPAVGTAYPETSEHSAPIIVAPDGEGASNGSASTNGGSEADPRSCLPKTCAEEGFSCGTLDDGCGGTLECGTCAQGQACTNDSGGNCAAVGTICKAAEMRLMGSCAAINDGPQFESGAACEDFYDSRNGQTPAWFEYKCDCNKGVWSPDPCSKRIKTGDCTIGNSANTCSRTVACFAAN
jgi:hypothetical protein